MESTVQVFELLQDTMPDLTLQNPDGNNALMLAAKNGNERYVEWFVQSLQNQHHLINETNHVDDTALIQAVREGKNTCVQILVQNNANVNQQNILKDTALMVAAEAGNLFSVELLLQHNAHADTVNVDEDNALLLAAKSGCDACVERLLQGNEQNYINHQNKKGETALMLAARTGTVNRVQLLLNARSRPDLQTFVGESALNYAVASESIKKIIHEALENETPHTSTAHNDRPNTLPAHDTNSSLTTHRPKDNLNLSTSRQDENCDCLKFGCVLI